jgi:hypothetical protein
MLVFLNSVVLCVFSVVLSEIIEVTQSFSEVSQRYTEIHRDWFLTSYSIIFYLCSIIKNYNFTIRIGEHLLKHSHFISFIVPPGISPEPNKKARSFERASPGTQSFLSLQQDRFVVFYFEPTFMFSFIIGQ